MPGIIVRYAYIPSKAENPVWVEVPDNKDYGFESTISSLSQTIKNFATNKVLSFSVGFEPRDKGDPEIEVYFNGKQAKYISNISEAPLWTPYRVFVLPASILGIGLGCTILWIAGSLVLRNQKLREELIEVLKTIGKAFIESISPIRF